MGEGCFTSGLHSWRDNPEENLPRRSGPEAEWASLFTSNHNRLTNITSGSELGIVTVQG